MRNKNIIIIAADRAIDYIRVISFNLYNVVLYSTGLVVLSDHTISQDKISQAYDFVVK